MRHEYLADLENRWCSKEISAAELTALCLLPDLVRSGTNFQRSPLFKEEICQSKTMEFIRVFNWRGHSDRIRRSLYQWHQKRYPLVLWSDIPSPFELLKIQSEGQRVITVFKKADQWNQIHLGKSAWKFTTHDLIHADHFFENSEWFAGQISFYQFMLKNWNADLMLEVRTHCPEQFDYLISDMNSHPQHMYQTLSALCLMARKKSLNLEIKTRLPLTEENLFQEQITYFLATR